MKKLVKKTLLGFDLIILDNRGVDPVFDKQNPDFINILEGNYDVIVCLPVEGKEPDKRTLIGMRSLSGVEDIRCIFDKQSSVAIYYIPYLASKSLAENIKSSLLD